MISYPQKLLGLPRASTDDDWVVIGGGAGPLQKAPDLKPPQWVGHPCCLVRGV